MSKTIDIKVKAEDLFSGLSPENNSLKNKNFELSKNNALLQVYNGFLKLIPKYTTLDYKDEIYKYCKLILPEHYTLGDVQEFCNISKSIEGAKESLNFKLGFYLSSLINNLMQEDILLDITKLKYLPDSIGLYNKKNLHLIGDVDYGLGRDMYYGCITLDGNCRKNLGFYMQGGKIIINGDAGRDVGCLMQSGEIHINGDYRTISISMYGGNIYHKGVQIVKNGKLTGGRKK